MGVQIASEKRRNPWTSVRAASVHPLWIVRARNAAIRGHILRLSEIPARNGRLRIWAGIGDEDPELAPGEAASEIPHTVSSEFVSNRGREMMRIVTYTVSYRLKSLGIGVC